MRVNQGEGGARRALRVVLITTFYPPYSFGGDAVHARSLARLLARAGHRVDVIHCVDAYRALARGGPGAAPAALAGVTVHGLASGYGALSPLLSQQTGFPLLKRKRIQAILDQAQPDVIHYHNVSLFGPEVLTLAPRGGAAVKLYTTHEYWLVCPTHLLWKYGRRPCEARDCVKCTLAAGRPPQAWRYTGMLERCAAHVDAFLAPSRCAASMHERFGFPRPLLPFPLFAEAPRPDVEALPRPHPRPYFLFVGRLEAVKAPRSLVDAWARVKGVDLVVAGTGTEAESLRALAAGSPRIRFTGQVAGAELAALYAHCIACVVPSAVVEVFPLVVLEAFAHGAPVIAHDIGALAEMIAESGGGVLYRDEDELVEALARLAGDAPLRAGLAANARRAATGPWSEDAFLARYVGLVSDLARRKFGDVPWERDAPLQASASRSESQRG